MADVYDWVSSCLESNSSSGSGSSAESGGLFELYTTPPRTVLYPYPSASSSGSSNNNIKSNSASGKTAAAVEPTLTDLRLVPAAVIYLAWKVDVGSGSGSSGSSSKGGTGSSSGSVDVQVQGAYLRSELCTTGSNLTAYPVGQSLAPPAATATTTAGSGSGQLKDDRGDRKIAPGKSAAGGDDYGGEIKRSSKPKWFK